MFADLHLHTNYSDGTYTPEELAGHARRCGLKAIALTDHDTVEGCGRTAIACQAAGIEFIPASELTAEMDGHEIHLLGYFLDTANPGLLRELEKFQQVRQDRIREMVGRINQLGIPLPVDDVFTLANCRSPGRPHVARALTEGEFCGSIDEAFERFLKKGKPAWVPKFKMSAQQAINLIQQAGGLAVMAHPGLTRADELIPRLADLGMDGLECFHSKHNGSLTEQYRSMATRLNLLITGGSDCHGTTKGKPIIGTVKLPYEYVEKLKTRVTERAAERGFLLAHSPAP
ncbi:MAG TPA: PHP domain-containing protein [Verrucomicrobiae bacterium]|nr:PHP domain-containing protein [Verrucomicrobiae bacterium]